MPSPHYKTCRRWNIPGHAHYLTFSCYRRQNFLAGDRARRWLVAAIARAQVLHDFHLWAWVIMPEHVHLLIWPQRRPYHIADILTSLKKPVTNAALRHVRRHAPHLAERMQDAQPNGRVSYRFWQRGGGYDRNIFTAEEVWEKVRYIHGNPLRRGLAAQPEEWFWSSAPDYRHDREPPLLPLNRESMPWLR